MMTRNNYIISITLILFLISACSSQHEEQIVQEQLKIKKEINKEPDPVNWSNPVLILGSSFGEIVNTYYSIGDFEKLYCFTDQETKTKYGKERLIEEWKALPLGMELRLLNKTVEGDVQWLHYETTISATRRALRIPVVVEDDTCRIVFSQLKNELKLISK